MKNARIFCAATVIGICLCMCASCGPHMENQPSIEPFSQAMPQMPSGTIPTSGSLKSYTIRQSRLKTSPLPVSKRNLTNGRIYYGYYCLMCHGSNGDGQGPVGPAYQPQAADLRNTEVAALSDGQLYLKMLTGPGHGPVMEETVFPDQRWPLVMYVRTFAKQVPEPSTTVINSY